MVKFNGSGTTYISTKTFKYEYDHLGRKTKFNHFLNGADKVISRYNYDEIGRLSSKDFNPKSTINTSQSGSWNATTTWSGNSIPTLSDYIRINSGHTVTINSGEAGSAGSLFLGGILNNYGTLHTGNLPPNSGSGTLQTLNFKYHIRGGLKGINLDASGNLTNKLFSYRLDYEEGTTGLFDGNIKKQYWKSNIDGKQRSFEFSYDGASRLKSGTYASTQAGENYSLNNVNYDRNGNITNLSRSDAINNTFTNFGNVDNLNYTYQSNSNKLSKIQDLTTSNADLGDFRDGINADDDYEYWLDGSLNKDKNKKIASITYNYLKLPEVITFDDNITITTEYDAQGTKLKKIVLGGETTDYEEDEIYVNNVLYQTSHDEGRINASGEYEYNINDHLGNLRISFRDSLGIAVPVQSIFYDPWGLSMKGMQISRNPTSINKHQFLGAETQVETGYIDLQNRQYDPQRGQFTSPDALAELSRRWSPFSYSYNNPIRFSDPDGLYAGDGDTYTTKDNNENDVYNDVNSQKVVGYGGKSEADESKKGGDDVFFNSDGSFNHTKKGAWYDLTPHNAYIKDSKGKNTRLQFNDQSDIKYFNGEKKPKFLQLITNQLIDEILNERKVNQLGFSSETEKYKYIYEQSGSTMNLDFAGSIPAASLAVFNEIIYNDKDFGNFLWGASMQRLGVTFDVVNSGSEFNGFWNGKVQNGYTPKFYIDRITWSGDAHEDQVAIRNGYLWALKNPKK